MGNATQPPASYGALKGCAKKGDGSGALRTLREMQAQHASIGPRVYTLAMEANAKLGNVAVVEALVDEMTQACIPVDRVHCNVRIKAFGNAHDLDGARALFEAMPERGLARDAITYNALITAHLTVGDVDGALAVLDRMRQVDADVKPDEATFTTLIAAFAQAGQRDRALALFRDMPEAGVAYDGPSYGAAMNACAEVGDIGGASGLLREMQGSGITIDAWHYNIAIKACIGAGQLGTALAWLEELRQPGAPVRPNLNTFNTLLHVCAKAGRLDVALALHREMQDRWGLRPNRGTDVGLVVAHASGGRVDEAVKLFERKFSGDLDRGVISMVLMGFHDPKAAQRWFETLAHRDPALRRELSPWCDLVDISARAGSATTPVLEGAIAAGAIGMNAGLRKGVLDFHRRALCAAEPPEHGNTCVSATMARALLAYHRERNHLTDTTQYAVGKGGADRIKQAVLEALREQGRDYIVDPDNAGRLIPRQAASAKAAVDWWDAT